VSLSLPRWKARFLCKKFSLLTPIRGREAALGVQRVLTRIWIDIVGRCQWTIRKLCPVGGASSFSMFPQLVSGNRDLCAIWARNWCREWAKGERGSAKRSLAAAMALHCQWGADNCSGRLAPADSLSQVGEASFVPAAKWGGHHLGWPHTSNRAVADRASLGPKEEASGKRSECSLGERVLPCAALCVVRPSETACGVAHVQRGACKWRSRAAHLASSTQ